MERSEERNLVHAEINRIMYDYYNTDNEKNKHILFKEAYSLIKSEANKMKKGNYEWEDCFHECIIKCREKFDPEKCRDFMAYFSKAYENGNISHHKKEKGEVSIEDSEEKGVKLDYSYDAEIESCAAERLIVCLEALCDSVIVIMKKNINSSKKCYHRYFFTEHISNALSESEVIYKEVSENTEKYQMACDADFIDSYISEKYDGDIRSLRTAKLKKLSEFTGKEKDVETYCGYPLKNCVYSDYLGVSDGAVVQQRNKYQDNAKLVYREAFNNI